MKLVVITPETDMPGEIQAVTRLFDLGLWRLHLRKKNPAEQVYSNYLQRLPAGCHASVSVHGCPDLFKRFPLTGIHCNTRMLEDHDKMKAILSQPPPVLSASFHRWDQIVANGFPFNYVFISPVFDSISKKGYTATVDLNGIKTCKETLRNSFRPQPAIFALGGVNAANLPLLRQAGFDGAAVLGDLWQSPDPVSAFKRLTRMLKSGE